MRCRSRRSSTHSVLNHKPRPDQLFGEVDYRILQERKRDGINQHTLAVFLEHQILGAGLAQHDLILKARTAAAKHAHAQRLWRAGDLGNFGQPRESAVGDARQRIGKGDGIGGSISSMAVPVSFSAFPEYRGQGRAEQAAALNWEPDRDACRFCLSARRVAWEAV